METLLTNIRNNILKSQNEAHTKNFLIIPILHFLGYNITNPDDICPEFIADIGNKKGEKVDFAILKDDKPYVLIECKHHQEKLFKHRDQLKNYFNHLSPDVKFGILTNGIDYEFFTSTEVENKMDDEPFFKFNIHNITDKTKKILDFFRCGSINECEILTFAKEEKSLNSFERIIKKEFENPSDELIRHFSKQIYAGVLNQNKLDEFRGQFKKALDKFINKKINIKSTQSQNQSVKSEEYPKIITTDRELKFYALLHGILISSDIDVENDVSFKDTEAYFGIFYKRRHLVRFYDNKKTTYIIIPVLDNKKIELSEIKDIFNYSGEIFEAVKLLNT